MYQEKSLEEMRRNKEIIRLEMEKEENSEV